MRFHPDVLACHAQFGGDLEDMQRRYDAVPTPERAAPIPAEVERIAREEAKRSCWNSVENRAEHIERAIMKDRADRARLRGVSS